ncbi:group 1 truncated hemoglobin [Luteipulveratus sp. YIM 133132]|uniref:group I truncated hemoglobin n=1 Tax=Luteipulveratus flavus TaxID=3031728 RepID=UPI0023B194C3|nr:group 1 truncated hemoglobin [Luteipulveratus sp. YIM 133132]MDE9364828.1 group 1 truncated hemoglobin [Luteipulveratus sp. YIM 133132]
MSEHDVPAQTVSDYEAVGGGPAVKAVVNRFYELVVGDPDLAPFFAGIDMASLKRHQVLLVSQVMGGPAEYDGRELRAAHAELPIRPEHFAAVVGHLVAALQEFSVPAAIIDRVVAALGQTQPDIVTADAH